jgi:endonuclease/exonuclease/phosphatase (EEP) superfamily protein YafD
MFIHAIAAEGAAKKQLREAATFVRTAAHRHKHAVILTGDLNCKADVLKVDEHLGDEIRKGLSILSTGKPTQYGGGELDYALACGIKSTSTIQLLPTHASDHRAILLSLDF